MATPELPADAYSIPDGTFNNGGYPMPDVVFMPDGGPGRFLPPGFTWAGPDGAEWAIVYQTARGGEPHPHWVLVGVPESD